ncbi:MAG: DUF2927 domain-containing protein [Myxococcota bacterium]
MLWTVLLGGLLVAHAGERSRTRSHVLSVMMRSEFGGAGRSRIVRWVTPPQLSVIGGTPRHREMVAQVADELSGLLDTAAGLRIDRVADPAKADMRLYFAPLDELPAIAEREGFSYIPGNLGLFWVFWDGKGQIDHAIILIAEDRIRDDAMMAHFLLEEMTQSLGLMNDSPLFPQSVFYETHQAIGTATRLPPLDQRTVMLLYGHVRPNARACEVRRAYRRHWRDIVADESEQQ